MSHPRPRLCPRCGAQTVVPILYGYPAPGMWKKVEQGEAVLGGCTLADDNPQWACLRCKHRF